MEQPTPEKKFWEGPYPAVQAPLKRKENLRTVKSEDDERAQRKVERQNELVSKIEKMAEQFKRDGYLFELTDNESEYMLRVKGFEGIAHITKVDDPRNVDIKKIIADRITHSIPG